MNRESHQQAYVFGHFRLTGSFAASKYTFRSTTSWWEAHDGRRLWTVGRCGAWFLPPERKQSNGNQFSCTISQRPTRRDFSHGVPVVLDFTGVACDRGNVLQDQFASGIIFKLNITLWRQPHPMNPRSRRCSSHESSHNADVVKMASVPD